MRVYISPSSELLQTPPFRTIFKGRYMYVRSVPGNMRVKFEVRSFNRFGAISI